MKDNYNLKRLSTIYSSAHITVSLEVNVMMTVMKMRELICDFLPSKFLHYPSRNPKFFVTTRPDPIPKTKSTTRQSLPLRHGCTFKTTLWSRPLKLASGELDIISHSAVSPPTWWIFTDWEKPFFQF